MKKLTLAVVTIAFIGLGSSPVMAETPAPTPKDCAESSVTFPGKTEYCQSVLPRVYPVAVGPPVAQAPTVGQAPAVVQAPPVAQAPTATTTTVVAPAAPTSAQLPRTGSSGVSTTLGIGALLILGGGIVAVATKRRSTAASPT